MPDFARRRKKRLRNLTVAASSLIGSLVFGFVLWQIAVVYFQMPSYVLPAPRAVLVALADGLAQSPTARASGITSRIHSRQRLPASSSAARSA